MRGYEIRPLGLEDVPALEAIRVAAFAPVFAGFRATVGVPIYASAFANAEREQADFVAALYRDSVPGDFLVAVQDGAPIGFVAVTLHPAERFGEIAFAAVHPDHAGKGVGTALFGAAIARMKEAGMVSATVSTGGDERHAAARRAYEKAGFGAAIPAVSLYRLL
ncbi:MAG: GNAT family N-acetyltransferase [Alphaproteobacteria bacterium]|nr:GNAT family N-acetyltransferase [Alphaproteobacteria bacterium]